MPTDAWIKVQRDIEQYISNPVSSDEIVRVPAVREANPKQEVKSVAAAKKKRKKAKRGKTKRAKTAARKTKRKTTKRRKKRAAAAAPAPKKRRKRRKKAAAAAAPAPKKRRKRRKKAKAKRKTTRRRKSARAKDTATERTVKVRSGGTRTQVIRVEVAAKEPRRAARKSKKRKSKRRKNPAGDNAQMVLRDMNPAEMGLQAPAQSSGMLGGLLSNPDGPFTGESLRGYAIAAGGVGFGLVIADFLDRYVATRTPDDSVSPAMPAKHPWYGRDAAAAQRRRPDAMRLGAQAAGAVVAMALTYWTRNGNVMPWLFGGSAIGFGANLLKQITDWFIMPAIFSVDKADEESFANRMFPLEQTEVQDEVDKLFENWGSVPALVAGQGDKPVISSPLAGPGVAVYTLGGAAGKAGSGQPTGLGRPAQPRPIATPASTPASWPTTWASHQPPPSASASPELIQTGMLGKCGSCGGDGGCYATCQDYTGYVTSECNGCGGNKKPKKCFYVVKPGDNFSTMVAAANADMSVINAMNGGGEPSTYWYPGNKVMLPFVMCRHIETRTPPPGERPPPRLRLPERPGSFTTDMDQPGERPPPIIPVIPEGGGLTPGDVVQTFITGVGDTNNGQKENSLFSLFNED